MKSEYAARRLLGFNAVSSKRAFMILISGVIVLSMLSFFQTAQAGDGEWITQGSGPGGTSVLALAVDPQSTATMYAGTYFGIYKSMNGGENWVNSTNNLLTDYGDIPNINTIAIHPLTKDTLYVGSSQGGGVFKSTDGGLNWTSANNGITTRYVETVVIDPQDPAILYAGTMGYDSKGGVFKSSDNGQSWALINSDLPTPAFVYSIVVDPIHSNTIYAGLTGAGIYKSIDGGGSWTALNTDATIKSIRTLINDPNSTQTMYAGTAGSGIYKSVDGGTTFLPINQGINSKLRIVTIWLANSSTIYAGTEDGGVYKSTDAGDTWGYSSSGVESSYIQFFLGIGNDPSILYTATSGGIFETTNSGSTWNARNLGLPAAQTEALLLLPQEPYTLYAGTAADGIFAYQDQGWTPKSSGISNTWIRSLAYDPITPSTLYAGTFFGGIYKSTDSGSHWVDQNAGLPMNKADIRKLIVNPINPTTIYAGLQDGVYESVNGGNTWSKVSNGIPSIYQDIEALAVDEDNPETMYAGTIFGGVFKTTNGGQTWSANNNGLTDLVVRELAVDPNQSSVVYAGTEGQLFRSIDSGETWVPTDLKMTSTSILFDPSTPDTIYTGTEGWGVFRSVDNGLTWDSMTTTGFLNGRAYIYDLAFDPNAHKLFAATMTGTDLSTLSASKATTPGNMSFLPDQSVGVKINSTPPKSYSIFALCVSKQCETNNTVKFYLPLTIK